MAIKATIETWEDTDVTVMARITGGDGENIVQADVSTITLNVYDCSEVPIGDPVITSGVDVATTVFDTLQTPSDDPRWTTDTTGYNFASTITGTVFSTGGHVYRAEYAFVGASAEMYKVVAAITTKDLLAS